MGAGVDLAIGDFVYEFDNIYDDFDIKVIKEVYHILVNIYHKLL